MFSLRFRTSRKCASSIGRVAADSIFFRDYAMLQGAILVLALAVLPMNLLTDILYSYLDPRIRYG